MPLAPLLVLDGEQRASLAVVRSLGRHGYDVHVGSHRRRSMAGGSRFAMKEVLLPDSLRDPIGYAAEVATCAAEMGAPLTIPVTDASTLALLEHLQPASPIRLPGSDLEAFRRANNKPAVLETARAIGIQVPSQWTLEDITAPLPEIPEDHFPIVIKPARSVTVPESGRLKVGVSYAQDLGKLRTARAEFQPETYPLLLQRRITGPGIGVFLLRWQGAIWATFAHRRLKEFPPSGGVSVTCESTELPASVRNQAESLIHKLDWTGVAMVEFKLDRETGTAYLMEVNPRFWGSLQLAIDAGVDFPALLVGLALGESVTPVRDWRVGIRNRWEWGAVDYLIARLTKSRQRLDLPLDAPSTLHAVVDALVPWRPGQRNAVFRWNDPFPFFRESLAWLRALKG